MREILNFNYDYSKCMAMKLGMAYPEKKIPNKSHILLTFEDALEYIKEIDNIDKTKNCITY